MWLQVYVCDYCFLAENWWNLGIPFKARDSNPYIETLLWLRDCLILWINCLFRSSCWSNQNYIQNHWCITSFRLVFIIHSFISYPYLEYIFRIRWSQLRNRPSFRRFFSHFRTTHHPKEFPLFHMIAWFHISLKAQILIDNSFLARPVGQWTTSQFTELQVLLLFWCEQQYSSLFEGILLTPSDSVLKFYRRFSCNFCDF